jgi:MFS family permease
MSDEIAALPAEGSGGKNRLLFWGCFIALVATAFAFIIRVMLMDQWQIAFGLSETEKGQIFGAGLWPFGISIVLFSLILDKIGYGRAMVFAFLCHVGSTVLLVSADGYNTLWMGSVLNGLAAGTVEAVINPVVASMYRKNKTKMLTILHAGWPGGFVLGGLMILGMGGSVVWQVKVGLILIPTVIYGLVLLRCKFPQNERVASGVPYMAMLKECGALGMLIVTCMIVREVGALPFVSWSPLVMNIVTLVIAVGFGLFTRSLGRPMYTFLLLVMILLAITELGTDAWIKELMGPGMSRIGLDAGWVLVYTATIMMILRFCIGPIVEILKPLGVLLVSSLFAAAGLYFLAGAEGAGTILIAATIYGVGQTFFWPVTIGLCAERFPKGGALTINAIAGVGMLGVGIIGAPLLGNLQDKNIDQTLRPQEAIYARVIGPTEKASVFGKYRAIDGKKRNAIYDKVALHDHAATLVGDKAADKKYQMLVRKAYDHLVRQEGDKETKSHDVMVAALTEAEVFVSADEYQKVAADKKTLDTVTAGAKKSAMSTIAILPLIMAACYLGLIIYFKKKGGYKAVDLSAGGEVAGEHDVTPEEAVADAEATPSE